LIDLLDSQTIEKYNAQRQTGPKPLLCYAPMTNMYFGHHGKITACCHNRTYLLGQYPDKTIAEIWNGEKAEQLRNLIKQNELPISCYDCKLGLESGNFDAVKAKMYDALPVNADYPSVLEFELSNTCNLECIMCKGEFSSLIRKNRENKPPLENPYDSLFVDQLVDFIPHLYEVKFYGGEPFLIDIYYEIWDKILSINPKCRISVQTNATVLNDRVKGLLAKGNFHLNISLDSLSKDTYEAIRVNADFERTMDNIKFFHDYCKRKNTFFGISACPMQQNWKELPDFINFCNELEAPVYFHTVWSPADCALMKMTAKELKKVCLYLEEYEFPKRTAIENKNRRHYQDYLSQIKSWSEKALITEESMLANKAMDEHELMKLLQEKILNHLSREQIISQGSIDINFYLDKMNQVMHMLPTDTHRTKTLNRIASEPIEPIIALLQTESEEYLLKKLLNSLNGK